MPDIPDRQEIEELLGGELPIDIPIEQFESHPDNYEDFDLVGYIKGRWMVLKKSSMGQLSAIYIMLCGLGCPIPTPWDLTIRAYEGSTPLMELVYSNLINSDESGGDSLWVEDYSLGLNLPLSSQDFLSDDSTISLSAFVLPQPPHQG